MNIEEGTIMGTNEYFLKGLLAKESKVLDEIYDQFFPAILRHVKSNSGSVEDAEDIFQDSLVILFQLARKKELHLSGKFSTYLFAVARNQWYKRLRDVYKKEVPLESFQFLDSLQAEQIIIESERQQLIKSKLKMLSKDCQKILELHLQRKSMQQIAELMGYTGAGYARKKKCNCQQNLIKLVKADPRYKELK